MLGLSSATVSYWKKKLGKPLCMIRQHWAKIQEAHDNGASYTKLAEMFGVARRSLQRARNKGQFIVRKRKKKSPEERRANKRESWMRYHSKKKYQTPANEDIKQLQEFYRNCPKGYEVDHIIPISKGGLHSISNLQYLTVKENQQKSDKIL